MSTIPTKQIDGDVAVGRNVSAGGNANIQGNARVGHDLVVEGWLEAKNIKSANKGLFATVDALRAAYPHVHEGWFAGVPATDKEISDLGLSVEEGKALYRMYIGCGGEWVCEPLNKLYEITVDNRLVEIFREELTTLRDDHDHLEARVEAAETKMSDVDTRLTAEETRSQEKDEELAASLANETSRAGVAEQLLNDRIAQLKDALDTLDHENATEAIESFREILAFLEGISDDETLLAKLTEIKGLIDSVAGSLNRTAQQLSGTITSETNRATDAEEKLEERIDGHDTELESLDTNLRALYDGVRSHQRQFMQVEEKFLTEQGMFTTLSRGTVVSRPCPGAIVEANIGGVWQLWQYRHNTPDAQAAAQEEDGAGVMAASVPAAPDLNIADASNWVRLATIDDTTKVFIDMWNQACGKFGCYNPTTGFFELNGLTDITYEEAVKIYTNTHYNGGGCNWLYAGFNYRTNIPLPDSVQSSYLVGFRGFCYGANFEVLNVRGIKLDTTANVLTGSYKQIIGEIILSSIKPIVDFSNSKFEDVQFKGVNTNLLLDNSRSLSFDSVKYLVANATNSSAITIKVHPDVYAKLTGDTTNEAAAALSAAELAQWQEVLMDAANKNISFATV